MFSKLHFFFFPLSLCFPILSAHANLCSMGVSSFVLTSINTDRLSAASLCKYSISSLRETLALSYLVLGLLDGNCKEASVPKKQG